MKKIIMFVMIHNNDYPIFLALINGKLTNYVYGNLYFENIIGLNYVQKIQR